MDKRIEILKSRTPAMFNDRYDKKMWLTDEVMDMMQEYAEWLAELAYNAGIIDVVNDKCIDFKQWFENFKEQENEK